MHRRQFLSSAAAAISAPAFGHAAQPIRRLPNIVLIMADDLGYECLACNGATQYRTPNLDRLAAQGVRFTHAHSTPLCTPTRVQLMTGKYNFRNYTEFGSLPSGERTFAHHLKQAGYRTAVTGKWQLAGAIEGSQYKGVGTLPEAAGFDEHCLWQVRHRGSRYWNPTVQIDGRLQRDRTGDFGPDMFAGFAQSFIERHRQQPFFLYYPMVLTHDPFVPTPKSKIQPTTDLQKSDPIWFADMVAYMDHVVGLIAGTLERHGIAENTVLLFTADNGTHPSITTATVNGPYQGGKGSTTSAGTHVPLLASWPGTAPRGSVCPDLIDFTDFFPTLSALASLPMPEGHPCDGQSFLPQLRGESGTPRTHIYCDYNPRWGGFKPARWAMDHRWKLYGDGRFYDLSADLGENRALQDVPVDARDAAERLRSVLKLMRN